MIDDYYKADFVITREIGQLGGCFPRTKKIREEGKKEKRAEVLKEVRDLQVVTLSPDKLIDIRHTKGEGKEKGVETQKEGSNYALNPNYIKGVG